MRFRSVLWFFIVCGLCLQGQILAGQGTEETGEETITLTLNDMGYFSLPLNGGFGTAQLFLPIPWVWEATQDAQVSLDLLSSPLLKELSSLTVEVNGQPISSTALNASAQTFDFTIPAELIRPPGVNVLFRGYLRVTDEECEDSSIPSQWMRVEETSRFDFFVALREEAPQLSELPQLFSSRDITGEYHPLLFVLPDDVDEVTISVAAKVAAMLGRMMDHVPQPFEVVTASRVQSLDLRSSDIVVIGLPENQPLFRQLGDGLTTLREDNLFYTDDNLPVAETDGVLQLMSSPWNIDRHVLVASANQALGLANLGEALLAPSTMANLHGNYIFVAQPLRVEGERQAPPWSTETTSLAQLGYGSPIIRGIGTNSQYYTIRRAPGTVFDVGGQFVLQASASPIMRDTELYVAVFLNEYPIGSYSIGDLLDSDGLVFQIPTVIDEARYLPELTLRIEISSHIAQEECKTVDRDTAWVQIDNSSSFVVNNVHLPIPNLEAFPYPYVNESGSVSARLVLPYTFSSYHLDGLVRLAYTLGAFSTREIDLDAVFDTEFSQADHTGNLIFLLDGNTQPDINAFFPDAPFEAESAETPEAEGTETPEAEVIYSPFTSETALLADLALYRSLSDPFGLIFTDKSPVDDNATVLFVNSTTDAGFDAAVDGLTGGLPVVAVPATFAVAQPDMPPRIITKLEDLEFFIPQDGVPTATPTPTEVDTDASPAPLSLNANNASFVIIVIPIAISLLLIVIVWTLRRGRGG